MPEEMPGDSDELNKPPSFFPSESSREETKTSFGEPVKCLIEGAFTVQKDDGQPSYCVMLSDGDRKLPIWIGPVEAVSIDDAMRSNRPDRPNTHDLLRSVIDKLGAYVEKIVIDDLWNSTYYAKVFIEGDDDEPIEIDSRPSDAIAIAIRFNAPIYVSEGILDAAEDF